MVFRMFVHGCCNYLQLKEISLSKLEIEKIENLSELSLNYARHIILQGVHYPDLVSVIPLLHLKCSFNDLKIIIKIKRKFSK